MIVLGKSVGDTRDSAVLDLSFMVLILTRTLTIHDVWKSANLLRAEIELWPLEAGVKSETFD